MEDYRLTRISKMVGERVEVLKEFHRYCATPSGNIYNIETGRQLCGSVVLWYGKTAKNVALVGKDTHHYRRLFHILIAETFVKKPPLQSGNVYVAVAKDGNYLNCCADNLRWEQCTPRELGLQHPRKPRKLKKNRKTRTQVEQMVWQETSEAGRRSWGAYDTPFRFNVAVTDLKNESNKPHND